MGATLSTSMDTTTVQSLIDSAIMENKVMIFSKTTCPYCSMTKKLFEELDVPFKVMELNQQNNGNEIQAQLHKMTGARTVPRVFVNGNCIGGADATNALHRQGKLLPLIKEQL